MDLAPLIERTPVDTFLTAGGFEFIDELALALQRKLDRNGGGPVAVSTMDLAWLLDGYARARLSPPAPPGVPSPA